MSYVLLRVDSEGRIAQEMHCSNCEANLEGLLASGVCLDCETPISNSVSGRAVCRVDDDGRLLEETRCRQCGYELVGLDPLGNCPECGAPIGFSLEGDLLRYANPHWLKNVSAGLLCYIITLFVTITLGITTIVLTIVFRDDPALRVALLLGLAIVTGLLSLIAIWFVTWPHRGAKEMDPGPVLRFWTRSLVIISMLAGLAGAILSIQPKFQMYAQLPGQTIGTAATLVFILYLRRLARRVPDDKLDRHTGIVLFGMMAGAAVNLVGSVIVMSSGIDLAAMQSGQAPPSFNLSFLAGSAISSLGGLTTLVFFVWFIILLFKYRNRFSRAARLALRVHALDE